MIRRPSDVATTTSLLIQSHIAHVIVGDEKLHLPVDPANSLFWVEVEERTGAVHIVIQYPPLSRVKRIPVESGRLVLPYGRIYLTPEQMAVVTQLATRWQGQFTAMNSKR